MCGQGCQHARCAHTYAQGEAHMCATTRMCAGHLAHTEQGHTHMAQAHARSSLARATRPFAQTRPNPSSPMKLVRHAHFLNPLGFIFLFPTFTRSPKVQQLYLIYPM